MKMKRFLLATLALLMSANAVADPRASTATAGVQILTPAMTIPGLDRQRTIRIYLPPSYRQGDRRYPVLYMHDGQNLFDDATSYIGEWGVDESMDALAKSNGIEVIVVGIDNGLDKRINELNPWPSPRFGAAEGKQYMEFVVNTVKPYIDAHYRSKPGRADTGIMGSSLGGLISQYAIYQYPDVFAKAGIFSPAYWFARDIYSFSANRPLPAGTRLYVVAGDREGDDPIAVVNDTRQMQAQLQADDKVVLYSAIRAGAEHNETFWKNEFPQAMIFLYGKR